MAVRPDNPEKAHDQSELMVFGEVGTSGITEAGMEDKRVETYWEVRDSPVWY